jgi:hypothetical protein
MIAQLSEELVWGQIVARAWHDEGFMKRLLSDPRTALAEHDLEVPTGMEVEVLVGKEVMVDETNNVRQFILPAFPPHDLIEEDLRGGAVAWCGCGACGRCGGCGCRCRC